MWTIPAFQLLTRSVGPAPSPRGDPGATITTGGAPLPGATPVRHDASPSLNDYDSYAVATSFEWCWRTVNSDYLRETLSYDYTDERDQRRVMTGLGAHKSGFFGTTHGQHATYMSDTIGDGRPRQFYNIVMEHNYPDIKAAMTAWRNTACVSMATDESFMITAAFGFAMPLAELAMRLGLPPNAKVPEVGAALYVAQYGYPHGARERRGDTGVFKGPQGQVEITYLHQGNKLVLALVNNVRGHSGFWGRSFYQPHLTTASPALLAMLKDQGPEGSADVAVFGPSGAHDFYTGVNHLISQGTGIGATR